MIPLGLIFSIISAATCTSPSGADRKMLTPSPILTVVKAKVQSDALLLGYRVNNTTDHPVYLTVRLFRHAASGLVTDSNLVYTEVKEGVLRLTKALLPVPDHIDVEVPEVPYVVKLDTGKSFEETIRVSLPVEPFHPYQGVKRVNDVRTFSKVELAIGWLTDDGGKVDQIVRAGQPAELQIHHQTVAKQQQLLTATVDVQLPAHLAAP